MVSNEIPITFCAFKTIYAEPLGIAQTWSVSRPMKCHRQNLKNMQIALREMFVV